MCRYPKILRVGSGKLVLFDTEDKSSVVLLDENAETPRFIQKMMKKARLDVYLGLRAKLAEKRCDMVWAGSENIGLLLSFMGLRKPLIVIAHHMKSPLKAKVARFFGVVRRWSGIGYVNEESKNFFQQYFKVDPERLFLCESAKYLDRAPECDIRYDGPVVSIGVAKRDYETLIAALSTLPGYQAELFISSKFGDTLANKIHSPLPDTVQIHNWVSEDELIRHYQRTHFVVVPLQDTTHDGAGLNAVLEAAAFQKAVIATDTGGMSALIEDGVNGLLVPPGDVDAWREALRRLCEEPGLAEQMGRANRRFAEEHYNPKEVDRRIDAFVLDLFNQQAEPAEELG